MIYFIQNESGYIKIGKANNVKNRLTILQIGSTEKLTLLGTMAGDYYVERNLHFRFRHLQYRGEWFSPGEDLLEFIKSPILDIIYKPKASKKVIEKSFTVQEDLKIKFYLFSCKKEGLFNKDYHQLLNYYLFRLIRLTGISLKEVVNLKNCDFRENKLFINDSKKYNLDNEITELIDDWIRTKTYLKLTFKPEDSLFCDEDNSSLSKNLVEERAKLLLKRVGIYNRSIKSFICTFKYFESVKSATINDIIK